MVVSRQPLTFSWRNSELIGGDLPDAVASLKADAGIKGILIPGSISVVQQLLAAGLVDKLRLLVHPVAARKGRRLFDEGDTPYHLRMTATEAFPTGAIRVIYSLSPAPGKVGYDDVKDRVPAESSHPRVSWSGVSETRKSGASKRAPTEATPAASPVPASIRAAASMTRGAVTA